MIARLLTSALILSLASCTSAFVPIAHEADLPLIQSGQDSDLDSVIYQGEAAQKAKQTKQSHSAVMFLLGGRSFEETDWFPVEDQVIFGFEWIWMPAEGHIGIEVGTAFSYTQEDLVISSQLFTFTGSTFEAYVGPRFEIGLGDTPLRIYAGIGPSIISARFSGELLGNELSDSDVSFGLYAHGGVLLELGKVYLGVDVRTLTGTSVTLFDVEADADYTQVAIVLGFGL